MGLIIGVTGGVACGKSTVSAILSDRFSMEAVDSDQLAKRLMEEDQNIRKSIETEISPLAYGRDGRPDRSWLREAIFSDPCIRDRLNAIVHPVVRECWMSRVRECRLKNGGILVEIPLLYEVSAAAYFDEVVVVGASPITQVQRLVKERGISELLAWKMLASQQNLSDKIDRGSRVLWNDTDLNTLKRQADYLAALLLKTPV